LLHAGAPTADILRTYTLCIHVLRLVDPSGVTLDRVSGPVRAYLVQRPDTIRCVVQALTDPTSDLFAELCKAPTEPGALRGPAGSDAAEDWTPEPADALPQGEGVSRHKDLVELLVKIFGGSEAFVGEFKVRLC
jgi:anaphase-promoting complex subunit 2